jgi:hypothetical protein
MPVSIYEEKSKTGRSSLILQTFIGGNRYKRSLKLYFQTCPQNEKERKDKKDKFILAKKIAQDEEARLLNGEYLMQEKYQQTEDFISYAHNFIAQHAVKDKRKYLLVIKKLQAFFGKKAISC